MNKTPESLAIKALEMIAGERMCINNLLSDKDIAREALTAIREALADHSGDANEMVAEHKCGGCAKTAADGWVLYCVECWEKAEQQHPERNWLSGGEAEPVNQEPVSFDKWDVDEAKRILPMMRQGVALLECVAGALPKSAEPVKQEPVAWAYIDADGSFMDALNRQHGAYQTPLYAAPVQHVKQEPVAVVKKSLTTELLTDALTSILKMDVKGYELQERLQFSTSGRQLLEKAKNALSSIEAIDSIEKPIDAEAIREALADHVEQSLTMVAEPVKQEPVATKQLPDPYDERDGVWFDLEGLERLKALPAGTKLYAAPVDAEAIRAEALEEAAKVCESKKSYNAMHANTEFAAAIRKLK